MNRRFLKLSSFVLALTLVVAPLTGCGQKKEKEDDFNGIPEAVYVDDQYRVFYEIFTGSFSDANGDGTGDIRGIINRLDYLNDGDPATHDDLGITGIWLTPIFESPSYHKYDVKNYYKIDPEFGTEDDLKELAEECHKRGIKLIIDLVLNHTSNKNDWFKKFEKAHLIEDTESEYYDFYTCVTRDTKVPGSSYQFLSGSTTEMYECNFALDMPELNFDNDFVRETCLDIAKYWLDLGVDGFRFDAIKYVYNLNTEKNVSFWTWYMDELKKIKPDIWTVGECWSANMETVKYAAALNTFDFGMASSDGRVASAVRGQKIADFTQYIADTQKELLTANSNAMPINFIANHDMDRAAGSMTVDGKKAYMAANLYLLAPGTPFIYYGEEIGLKGSRGSASTDANRRLAMLWGDGDKVSNPVGSTYSSDNQKNGTVASQQSDENSLINYYKKVLDLREAFPEIARGVYSSLSFDAKVFGGFEIEYKGEKTYLFHNTGTEAITIDLKTVLESDKAADLAALSKVAGFVGQGRAELKGAQLTLDPQTSVVLK